MRTLAMCCASFKSSVRRAAGVEPILSPPVTMELADGLALSGYDFYYFKLHGLAGERYWYGDNWITAISAGQLARVKMPGAVVFVAGCHLYGAEGAPMLDVLFDAGASVVVGGEGLNFAQVYGVKGADLLGRHFRLLVSYGLRPGLAFRTAKALLRAARPWARGDDRMALDDALGFRMFRYTDLPNRFTGGVS